jgi:hypothetical protein
MTIYDPTPKFSEADKRLLALLGKLLLEKVERGQGSSNLSTISIALTDREAEELLSRIKQLLSAREFMEAAHFVEALTLPGQAEEAHARELYLSNRKRRGRSRVLASAHWLEFKTRLGLSSPTLVYGHRITPMSLDQFQDKERRLLLESGVHQEVVTLVMDILRSNLEETERIRTGNRPLRHGVLRHILFDPYQRWITARSSHLDREVSVSQVSAAMLLVADISVLFTTRDWGVAGTISTMASSAIALASP